MDKKKEKPPVGPSSSAGTSEGTGANGRSTGVADAQAHSRKAARSIMEHQVQQRPALRRQNRWVRSHDSDPGGGTASSHMKR